MPLFWYPLFEGDETHQAFFISRWTSRQVQANIEVFVYRTYEHGWISFLNYVKHKIYEENSVNECFTSKYDRVSFPYRWSELIPANYSLIFSIAFLFCALLFVAFVAHSTVAFLRPRLHIRWLNVE